MPPKTKEEDKKKEKREKPEFTSQQINYFREVFNVFDPRRDGFAEHLEARLLWTEHRRTRSLATHRGRGRGRRGAAIDAPFRDGRLSLRIKRGADRISKRGASLPRTIGGAVMR